jgi:hypothetical protein
MFESSPYDLFFLNLPACVSLCPSGGSELESTEGVPSVSGYTVRGAGTCWNALHQQHFHLPDILHKYY